MRFHIRATSSHMLTLDCRKTCGGEQGRGQRERHVCLCSPEAQRAAGDLSCYQNSPPPLQHLSTCPTTEAGREQQPEQTMLPCCTLCKDVWRSVWKKKAD